MKLGCFVPARLGSKRVPRKNVRSMAGKPMLVYTVAAAVESGLFEHVYVCTESDEIASVAREHGGEVTGLVPEDMCGDLVPSWKPCMHVAEQLNAGGAGIDVMVCLQPTSPLRSSEDIERSVSAFIEKQPDFVVSGTLIDPHYFHWALEEKDDGRSGMVFGDRYLVERPLLPPRYRPNGSIKIGGLAALAKQGHFFGPDMICVETPEERSVHVGNELEFRFCEYLLGASNGDG